MTHEEKLVETMLHSQSIFQGKILHLFHDAVRLPDGGRASREVIRHVGAVCVVPLTDDGQVIVERQFRYPVNQILTEIPAGKLNFPGEDPEDAIRRELREETGYTADQLVSLGQFYPAPAYCDETIGMYLAKGLHRGQQALDCDEFLELETIPLETLVAEILAGRIPDLKTQAAVLRAYLMERGNI